MIENAVCDFHDQVLLNNDFRVVLILWSLIIFGVLIGVLIIVARYSVVSIDDLYGRIESLNLLKQDDTSAYLTDEQWYELSKHYGFEWDVKPYHQITYNQAVKLFEELISRKEKL